jgi:hypothetical protein
MILSLTVQISTHTPCNPHVFFVDGQWPAECLLESGDSFIEVFVHAFAPQCQQLRL